MIKTFYHASNTAGLSELLPLSYSHADGGKVCYFTPYRSYALFYLRDMDINHVTCGMDKGIAVYHEQFPRQTETLYKGRGGYIYSCTGNGLIKEGHTQGVWIADEPVKITTCEKVDDVYNEIIKLETKGEIRIIRYESLPETKKDEISEMIKKSILKNNYLNFNSKKSKFFKDNFPKSWENALYESQISKIGELPKMQPEKHLIIQSEREE